jgi:uncharacterized protein YkwD
MTSIISRSRGATVLAAALICLTALALAPTAASAAPGDPTLDPQEHALCVSVNAYRAQHGLAPLKVSVALTNASKWLSADMAHNDYLDHTDSLGRSFTRRITAFGYRGPLRSENIAAGSADAAGTLEQWKQSAPHRRNLLSRTLKVIGIGRSYDADSLLGWYWAAEFGGSADRTIAC